ncbi:ArsR family transcriptional regulator [Pseudonocardia sp. CNS-139]|nr:ArsR family transcriptional regulator [Pseudonocardia sp. CNS-139]
MQGSNDASWQQLSAADALTYAGWFGCLAEPMRVRMLHAVAISGRAVTIGELTEQLDISQSTCSHHVRKLAEVGLVQVRRKGTATLVSVDVSCCAGMPNVADLVMGLVAPQRFGEPSPGIVVRPLEARDWGPVRRIYAEGIAAQKTTFETEVPSRRSLEHIWIPGQRWIAEIDGRVAGWAAAKPISDRPEYAGVVETMIHLGDGYYGRGIGRALIHRQVTAADRAGLWTLQTSVFPENRARTALHLAAGFRTLGMRERIGRWHGEWRHTLVLERRRAADPS